MQALLTSTLWRMNFERSISTRWRQDLLISSPTLPTSRISGTLSTHTSDGPSKSNSARISRNLSSRCSFRAIRPSMHYTLNTKLNKIGASILKMFSMMHARVCLLRRRPVERSKVWPSATRESFGSMSWCRTTRRVSSENASPKCTYQSWKSTQSKPMGDSLCSKLPSKWWMLSCGKLTRKAAQAAPDPKKSWKRWSQRSQSQAYQPIFRLVQHQSIEPWSKRRYLSRQNLPMLMRQRRQALLILRQTSKR